MDNVKSESQTKFREKMWLSLRYEYLREFFNKKNIAFVVVFTIFTGLVLFILNVQLTETFSQAKADEWIYFVGDVGLAFFAGIIGIGVSSYLGGQLLSKDLKNGSIRLINSYPISRKSIYISRIINGGLLYLPLSIGISLVVVSVGTLMGFARLGYSLMDHIGLYFRTVFAMIIIMFMVGFLAAMMANLFGIIFGSETQGIVLSVVILAFGDIVVTILASIVPNWHLEVLSITYHRTKIYEYLLQVSGTTDSQRGFERVNIYQSAHIGFPISSFVAVVVFPFILAYLGYIKFKRMDLE